jgi:hypothetical protein
MHQTVFPNLRRAVRLTFLNVIVSLTYDPFQASILLGFSRGTKLTLFETSLKADGARYIHAKPD